jgi:hypothetical protein
MSLPRRSRRLAATVLLSLVAGVVATSAAPLQAQAPREGRTLISINPLGLPFKYVSAELEQKISGIVTLGGSVSYLDVDDESYASFEAKLRVYPNEEAFKGFSIGLAAGVSRLSGIESCDTFDCASGSRTGPSIAVLADYNWLLGKSKRVLVGTGVGAKRIFAAPGSPAPGWVPAPAK